MALLLKNDIVFLHIPKTGGSWVTNTLKQCGLVEAHVGQVHSDYERISNLSGHYPGKYVKLSLRYRRSADRYLQSCRYFCFVREPKSYYESLWRFYIDSEWYDSRPRFMSKKRTSRLGLKADQWHPWDVMGQWGRVSFDEFMTRMIAECPGYLANLYQRYIPFGANVLVGKQENLTHDFQAIMNELYGGAFFTTHISSERNNASKTPRPIWDSVLAEKVRELEFSVYTRFGYPLDE